MYRQGIYPEILPPVIRRFLYAAVWLVSRAKWLLDSQSLPLHARDWPLYLDIHVVSVIRLRSFPNLRSPKSLNDQIRWTMLFAQNRKMPELCDKLAVRNYVQERIGDRFLVPLIAHGNWEEVSRLLIGRRGMLKCTHDSGSALLVDSPSASQINAIGERFRPLLRKEYGVGKGEWPYGMVIPQLIFEELLPGTDSGVSPPDVKVHCVNGAPTLYEVIVDRQRQPHGSLFLPNGTMLKDHIRDDRIPLEEFPMQRAIALLEKPARQLALGFKYVRVDFYLANDLVFFGEMTFFPESGLFTSPRGVDTSALLTIPCLEPMDSVYDSRTQTLL